MYDIIIKPYNLSNNNSNTEKTNHKNYYTMDLSSYYTSLYTNRCIHTMSSLKSHVWHIQVQQERLKSISF